jgi:2-iminoacetate synthase
MHSWDSVTTQIQSQTPAAVERALAKDTPLTLDDVAALVSPAAAPYLEAMAQKSHALTLRRFGRAVQLYLPLYLSNECTNGCTYCGFNHGNQIHRKTLTASEILQELEAIKKLGPFEHILLVTGEDHRHADLTYMLDSVKLCHEQFSHVSMEVQPLLSDEYRQLGEAGVSAVYVYQETYHKEKYKLYHPVGKKGVFNYRLECPDRIGEAGIRKIGIGALLGLEDWRADSFFAALHLRYLEETYWQCKYSVALPRLRPHAGLQTEHNFLDDRGFAQLLCAWRLFDPDIDLSVSTRESADFRDHAVLLGATTLSAGSRTDPGGYSISQHELPQWEINDGRTPTEVANALRKNGYEPVWKDWDASLESRPGDRQGVGRVQGALERI